MQDVFPFTGSTSLKVPLSDPPIVEPDTVAVYVPTTTRPCSEVIDSENVMVPKFTVLPDTMPLKIVGEPADWMLRVTATLEPL